MVCSDFTFAISHKYLNKHKNDIQLRSLISII